MSYSKTDVCCASSWYKLEQKLQKRSSLCFYDVYFAFLILLLDRLGVECSNKNLFMIRNEETGHNTIPFGLDVLRGSLVVWYTRYFERCNCHTLLYYKAKLTAAPIKEMTQWAFCLLVSFAYVTAFAHYGIVPKWEHQPPNPYKPSMFRIVPSHSHIKILSRS